jgi:hypothetical protein
MLMNPQNVARPIILAFLPLAIPGCADFSSLTGSNRLQIPSRSLVYGRIQIGAIVIDGFFDGSFDKLNPADRESKI